MCVDVVRYTTCNHQRSHPLKKCKFGRNAGCFEPICNFLFGPVSKVPCTIARVPGKVDVVEGWCFLCCRTQFGGLDTTRFKGRSPGQYLRAEVGEVTGSSGRPLDWFPYRSQSQMKFDKRGVAEADQGEGSQRYGYVTPSTPSAQSAQVGQSGHTERAGRIDSAGHVDRLRRTDSAGHADRLRRIDSAGHADKPKRIDSAGHIDRPKRIDSAGHVDRPERIDRVGHGDRPERIDRAPRPDPPDRAMPRPERPQNASAGAAKEQRKPPITALFRDGRTVYRDPGVGSAAETAAPPDRPSSKKDPREGKATTSGEASRRHRPGKPDAKPDAKPRGRTSTGSTRKDKDGNTLWPQGMIHRDVRKTYAAAVEKSAAAARREAAAAESADGERKKKGSRSLLPTPNRKK